jgi:hypothetical protein
MFHATVCAIEGEKVTLAEAKYIIEVSQRNFSRDEIMILQQRKNSPY